MLRLPAIPRLFLASLALGLAGCATLQPTPQRSESKVAHRGTICERLYFGRAIPGGGEVTDAEWKAFVADVIATRFPDGFTIFAADGNWRGADDIVVREPAMVLEVLHHGSAAEDRALAEIAQGYIARFRQEAVMRVRMAADHEFVRGSQK